MVISLSHRLDKHISLEIMKHVLGSRVDCAKYNTGEILHRTDQTDTLKHFLIDLLPGAVFDAGGAPAVSNEAAQACGQGYGRLGLLTTVEIGKSAYHSVLAWVAFANIILPGTRRCNHKKALLPSEIG